MSTRRLRVIDDHAPPRFAIGVRVSRVMGRTGDTFHSPETQETGARRAIAAAGGIVDETVGERGVFYDLDVSGATAPSDRKGLGAALDLIRAGRLDGVAIYDLSRWSRETVSGLRELEEIAAIGGQVLSGSERIDMDTPHGVFSTTIHLAANQLRRAEAAKAWKDTHAARFQQGKPHGSVPLGYRRTPDRTVEHDPLLAATVAQAFTDFAAGTVSQLELARRFTRLRGRKVWQATVSDMLRSPFYTGHVRLNGRTAPGTHPPLIEQHVWDAVQRRLALTAGTSPRVRGQLHPLVGLVVCDLCDHALWRRSPSGHRIGQPGYYALLRCRWSDSGCPGIGNPRYDEVLLAARDEAVAIARGLRDDAAARADRQRRRAQAGVNVTELDKQLKAKRAELTNAASLLARQVMSETAYAALAPSLETEIAALELQQIAATDRAVEPSVTVLASAGDRIMQLWDDMTSAEQRASLLPFIRQVRVRPPTFAGEDVGARVNCIPVE